MNRDVDGNDLEDKLKYPGEIKKQKTETNEDKGNDMLVFVENDYNDLVTICSAIDKEIIPIDMQVLWEEQMKQMRAKSTKGYRWHPRFVAICIKFNQEHSVTLLYGMVCCLYI